MKELIKKVYGFKAKHKKGLMILLLIVVIPFLTSIILGYEMKANLIKNIPMVILDYDNSSFSRMLIEEMKNNEIFDVKYYVDTDMEMKNLMDQNKAYVGVIIPPKFSNDLKTYHAPNVLVFYDGSKMSVVSAAKSRMSEILLTYKAAYLKKILEGKLNVVPEESLKQIQPISVTYRVLYNPTKNYRNFLLPGMLIAVLQVGLVIMGVDRGRENNSRFSAILKTNIKWGIFGTLSIILTLGIQLLFFSLPYNGSILAGILITFLYTIAMVAFGIIFSLLIQNQAFATQISCVLVIPSSMLGGYTYPLLAMPDAFQKVGWMLAFSHYAESVRDLCMKPLGLSYIMPSISWMIGCILFEWILCYAIFQMKNIISRNKKRFKNEQAEAGIGI